jgi:hypothetical protein
MTKPIVRDPIYRRRVFDADIIELSVRWYITYPLSYRDLVEMMAERGIQVAHTTVLRWVTRYVPEFENRRRRFSEVVGTSWRVDETYISIKAKWHSTTRPLRSPASNSPTAFARINSRLSVADVAVAGRGKPNGRWLSREPQDCGTPDRVSMPDWSADAPEP